ncbi:MAG TPA: phosphatase PAP2 family protein [Candidatus Saccharimonadales bacterium]|nr:phosphatase PAP2 family protein [Candidatus Saccharimonadales bacterium]
MDSVIVFCAKYLIVLVGLVGLYVWLKQTNSGKLRLAATVVFGGIIALIVSKIAQKLYYDPRPFVAHNVKALFSHSADNGFPSDHTLYSMVVATAVYFYDRKWASLAFILTLIIGIARVAAHVHSPIDIIGALIIGAIASSCGYYLARLLWPSRPLAKTGAPRG